MKRTYPIGYKLEMGTFVPDEEQAGLIRTLFDMYANGSSYKELADFMQPHFPNENFDKAKIGRILKDKRYLGDERFCRLIDDEVFNKAQSLRQGKKEAFFIGDKAEILNIKIDLICPKCGHRMLRKNYDNKKGQYWTCSDRTCCEIVRINDDDFLEELKDILYEISSVPYPYSEDFIRKSIRTASFENETEEKILSGSFYMADIKKDITDLIYMKFNDIPDIGYIKKQISLNLDDHSEDKWAETVNKIGKRIEITKDGKISLVLKDETAYTRKERHVRRKEDLIYRAGEA